METRGTQQVREGREVLVTREARQRRARLRRGERMVAIAHRLLTHPYQLFPLSTFMELLGAAKSTISEDLGFLRQAFDRFHLGKVETLAGAAGGVRYLPHMTRDQIRTLVEDLCRRLRGPPRPPPPRPAPGTRRAPPRPPPPPPPRGRAGGAQMQERSEEAAPGRTRGGARGRGTPRAGSRR